MPKIKLTRNTLEQSSISIEADKSSATLLPGEIPKAIVRRVKKSEAEQRGDNQDYEVVFSKAEQDPEVQQVFKKISHLLEESVSQTKDKFLQHGIEPQYIPDATESELERISKKEWDKFVAENPDRAKAYKNKFPPISEAVARQEERELSEQNKKALEPKEWVRASVIPEALSTDYEANSSEEGVAKNSTPESQISTPELKKRKKKSKVYGSYFDKPEDNDGRGYRSGVDYDGQKWEVANFDEQTGDAHLQREEKRNLVVNQEELFKQNFKNVRPGDSVLYGDETWELLKFGENTGKAYLLQKVTTHIMVPQSELFKQNPEYVKPNIPIAEDETFDPKKEIKSFKPGLKTNREGEYDDVNVIPKENRRKELLEFRRKLAYQMQMMSKLQTDIIAFIREKPDAKEGEIYFKLLDLEKEGGVEISDENKRLAIELIEAYVEKHKKIKEVREKYPDDRDFFHALFGFRSRGKIKIIQGVITLGVIFEDADEYAHVFSSGFLNKEYATEERKNVALSGGGALLNGCLIPGLESVVFIEKGFNTSDLSEKIYDHEEQHAIKNLFGERIVSHSMEYWWKLLKNNYKAGNLKRKDIEEALRFVLKNGREIIQNDRARDEILAFFKDGSHPLDILNNLTKLHAYNYWLESGQKLKEGLKKHIDSIVGYDFDRNIINEISYQVNEAEYYKLLRDGIDSLFVLTEAGYSRDQAIALLLHEPLSRWRKTVARVLGEKNLHSQNYEALNKILRDIEVLEGEEEEKRKVVKTELGPVTKSELELSEEALKLRREKMAEKRRKESLESEKRIQALKERIGEINKVQIADKEQIIESGDVSELKKVESGYGKIRKRVEKEIRNERVRQKSESLWSRIKDIFNS